MTQPEGSVEKGESPGAFAPETAGSAHGRGAELAAILDGYLAALQAGRAPDRRQLLDDHPDLAAELLACLAGIDFIQRATGPEAPGPASLGEFRIIREIGRGGMGVVYEAEQTSLHRKVALKVLRFAAVADEEAMMRFQREAETVARLHHTNIVPIFAIGCDREVHYYAMQFIDGRSLAQVLADAQERHKPLAVDDIVTWGLQAAEALAHAHQRGVIHRDIKPSNLLLDPDGVVWLTDFGLAKREDEATLTVRGALMGTPRYMSPEQAESLERPVDLRSDLYSLGASLYELATGRPVFDSPTPQGVIRQIISDEPVRPRLLRPGLSRNLETVILKCLAKDPKDRYQTARALAGDLRAVLDGRPILARRALVRERVARFVRGQRKALSAGARATAAMVLVFLAGIAAWSAYSRWQLGHIVLSTSGQPLAAELLSESGDASVGEPFDIGTHTVVAVPHGDYRLRVTGVGLLGQTYRVAVNRGEARTHSLALALDEGRLLENEPIPYATVTEAVELKPGKTDFIEWTRETVIRRDGATGKVVWDASRPARPWEQGRDPVAWLRRLSHSGDAKRPGSLTRPAPDLNGDGIGDLVWALNGTPSLLALSGNDGALLWAYCAGQATAGSLRGDQELPAGRTLGVPCMADIDGDGTPELVAGFAVVDASAPAKAPPARRAQRALDDKVGVADFCVIAAVSGRSGKVLWNHAAGSDGMPLEPAASDRGAAIVRGKGRPFVGLGNGHFVRVDLETGRPLGPPFDFGFEPVRPLQYADLDGDGFPEVLAMGAGTGSGRFSLAAFTTSTGQRLWLTEVRDRYTFSMGKEDRWERTWPLDADLDGDGRAEIVIPDFDPVEKYSGVRAVDAVTGETRWTRPMTPYPGYFDGLVHLLEGPDLDGDGTNDVVTVWRVDSRAWNSSPWDAAPGRTAEESWLYVDALSGKDGHRLWWWRGEIGGRPLAYQTPVRAPFWWGRGPDGWPLLAIALGGDLAPGVPPENPYYPPDPPIVHLLAGSTGQETHTITALSWPRTADLDGDGLSDLWGSVAGKLRALRGQVPESWRALGKLQRAGDLDGDGIDDVLSDDFEQTPGSLPKAASRSVLARSGRDGHLLWKTRLDAWVETSFWPQETPGYTLSALAMPAGDLDRDGTPDVLVRRAGGPRGIDPPASLPLEVISGRSGRQLWSAGSIPPLGFPSVGYCRIVRTEARVYEPGKPPDLIVVYELPGGSTQIRLARLSGRDGGFVWDTLLFQQQPGVTMAWADEAAFGDLDGDGCLDAALPLHFVFPMAGGPPGAPKHELRAVSLRDGKLLWRQPGPPRVVNRVDFAVGDLDGDGRAEVVQSTVLPGPFRQRGSGFIELAALEGNNGSTRWTWRDDYKVDTESLIPHFALGDLDGKGRNEVCVSLPGEAKRRLVLLDGQGQERVRDDGPVLAAGTLAGPPVGPDADGQGEYLSRSGPPVDLDGDGRDELLLRDDRRLSASRSDLTGLWAWRGAPPVREILPAEHGRPATVLLKGGLGLDGMTGRAIWSVGRFDAVLADQGGTGGPRVLEIREGATVCRLSIPTSGEGRYLPPHGVAALPARAANDPRWERPLPWAGLTHRIPLLYFLLLAGINVGAPLGIFWLATRRGTRSLRLLLALPAMVAIPITGLSWLGRLLFTGAGPSLDRQRLTLVAVLSLLGVPLLAYAGSLAAALWRGRWGRLLFLAALTASASAVVGGLWLYFAIKQMPAREHYTDAGWYHIAWLGVYVVGVLLLLSRPFTALARTARRLVGGSMLGVSRLWSRGRNRTAASDSATPSEERPFARP